MTDTVIAFLVLILVLKCLATLALQCPLAFFFEISLAEIGEISLG